MKRRHSEKMRRQALIRHRMARRVEWVVMLLLLIISLAHLLRLVTGTELTVAGARIPLWVSLFGFLGPGALLGLFWWSHRH